MSEYTLIRSKRKTVSLQVTSEGEVIVRCPVRMTKRDVDAFVAKHADWIQRHLKKMAVRSKERKAYGCGEGQTIFYLGEAYTVRFCAEAKTVYISGGEIITPSCVADKKDTIREFLRGRAKEILPVVTAEWAKKTGLTPLKIKITDAKKRWGSCSGRNTICFSLRLICLPAGLIEYVVVHELCHLRHHDHSPAFYALLEQYIPDYRQRIEELKEFQTKIPI